MIQDIIINGLINGGVYALLAVGFSLLFGVARIIYLAHTALYMVAAYIIYACTSMYGLSPLLAAVIAILGTAVLAVVTYRLFIDRIREHETAVLLVTIALALAFQEIIVLIFGRHYRGTPAFVSGYTEFLGVKVLFQHWLILGVLFVALILLFAFLWRSRTGIAIRALSQDREIANLMGVNVGGMYLLVVAIAGALAALAGVMVAPMLVVAPDMWLHPLIIVLAIVVLGGMGSIQGSIAGAFILSFVESLVVFLVPGGAFLKGAVALALMVAVLLTRPEGLFGVVFEEERL